MRKILFAFLFISFTIAGFAQKDSLNLGDHYADDQLYILISYNQFYNQPTSVNNSGFSYGFSTGFIKDVLLNKQGTTSLGLGFGYNYDSFNHDLRVINLLGNNNFQPSLDEVSNKLFIHNLEIPLELRWRNSNAQKYSFWRIYGGIKASYNLSNRFVYSDTNGEVSISNLPQFNKWQYGLTLSVGYDAFTAHMYYGLTPLLENAKLNNGADISTKIIKIGIIFYLL